jgi:hypothetical protein
MNRHDTSGWQLSHKPQPINLADVAIAAVCVFVIACWFYETFIRPVQEQML